MLDSYMKYTPLTTLEPFSLGPLSLGKNFYGERGGVDGWRQTNYGVFLVTTVKLFSCLKCWIFIYFCPLREN